MEDRIPDSDVPLESLAPSVGHEQMFRNILRYLRAEPATVGRLARELDMGLGNLEEALDVLKTHDFIRQSSSPPGRFMEMNYLTGRGQQYLYYLNRKYGVQSDNPPVAFG